MQKFTGFFPYVLREPALLVCAMGIVFSNSAFAERELTTDRPDRTESPITVDLGRFQFETDLITYTQNSEDAQDPVTGVEVKEKTSSYSINNMTLKVGISTSTDFQFVVETFTREEKDVAGQKTSSTGLGDVTFRLKHNFFGNDGGFLALGLIPFVKLPSPNKDFDRSRKVEGGIILPINFNLGEKWGLGTMVQLNHVSNEDDNEDHQEFIVSASLSHDWSEKFGSYVEFYREQSLQPKAALLSTGDVGMTYGLSDNCQLDVGVNIGLTEAADDLNAFTGISFRF